MIPIELIKTRGLGLGSKRGFAVKALINKHFSTRGLWIDQIEDGKYHALPATLAFHLTSRASLVLFAVSFLLFA